MKIRESGSLVPLFSSSTRDGDKRSAASFKENSPVYPLDRRLARAHSRSGREKYFSSCESNPGLSGRKF
jgi:hypothetical protein